jgi:phosphoserine phosphatase RsbU/P
MSKFIFYTDGVTEAMNKYMEEYSPERLEAHLKKTPFSVQSIITEINKFTGGNPQSDDITVVMLESNDKCIRVF